MLGVPFLETSAKDGDQVEQAFARLAADIVNLQQRVTPKAPFTPPPEKKEEDQCSSCTT